MSRIYRLVLPIFFRYELFEKSHEPSRAFCSKSEPSLNPSRAQARGQHQLLGLLQCLAKQTDYLGFFIQDRVRREVKNYLNVMLKPPIFSSISCTNVGSFSKSFGCKNFQWFWSYEPSNLNLWKKVHFSMEICISRCDGL